MSKINKQNLQSEKQWYLKEQFYIDSKHWTSHPIFTSRERHWLAVDTEKHRFYGYLAKYILNKQYFKNAKILIAPIGTGGEVKYLQGLYKELHGIDISEIALSQCPKFIMTKEANILQSEYENESFDIVICPLFLHHVHKVGFKPFIAEYYRILRKGGVLAIQEPSFLFPMSWITSFLRIFMGNVTGLVPDEKPIYPSILTKELKEAGFTRIVTRGLHFNHVRFPIFIQLITLLLDLPLRIFSPFKFFANGIGWYCEKPK